MLNQSLIPYYPLLSPIIRIEVTDSGINQAKSEPGKYQGSRVFWGGTIISVKNFKDYSLIEVLKRPLSGTEPNDLKKAQGRFIAKISGFIDPIEYKTPNRITVTGTLQGIQKGNAGNYPYTYPVIIAKKMKFWRGKKTENNNDPYRWEQGC